MGLTVFHRPFATRVVVRLLAYELAKDAPSDALCITKLAVGSNVFVCHFCEYTKHSEVNFSAVAVSVVIYDFACFFEVALNGKDSGGFHGINPFFPWRSSLGVMPYALGVTISAGTVLCVSHPGLEPAMAALRWLLTLLGGLCLPVQHGSLED